MSSSEPLLEICVDCMGSIKNAIEGGANRLELCSALSEGGLTPSFGLAQLAKRITTIPVFAMIRIRGGDFVYQPEEIDAMLDDIKIFKSIGIDGIVFGALTDTNKVDIPSCQKVIEAAKPLPVTFHRAFDDANNPMIALDEIINLGFSRILSSGQKSSALEGVDLIFKLIQCSKGKIIIMPGAGVTEKNLAIIRDRSGAMEFHGSAKKMKNDIDSGRYKVGSNSGIAVTDVDVVRQMVKVLREKL